MGYMRARGNGSRAESSKSVLTGRIGQSTNQYCLEARALPCSPVGISTCGISVLALIAQTVSVEVARQEIASGTILQHSERLVDAREDLIGDVARRAAQALDELGHVLCRFLRRQPAHEVEQFWYAHRVVVDSADFKIILFVS